MILEIFSLKVHKIHSYILVMYELRPPEPTMLTFRWCV